MGHFLPNRRSTNCRILWLLLLLVAVGCSREPFPLVQVEGKVTYQDGQQIPAESLAIRFIPLAEPRDSKTYARPGIAFTGNDGVFNRVTTHKANDGIVRGRHKVLIQATPDGTVIPKKYHSFQETPLEVDSADSPFHLQIERP